jgi:hypothetical protein
VHRLGITTGSMRSRVLGSALASLASQTELPGVQDFETTFHPGRAFVRRVLGQNLWVLYRFDAVYLDILTVWDQPPIPLDDDNE